MKKSFLYASALVMLLASCSNEDVLTPGGDPGQNGSENVVKDLKISLVSGTGDTRSGGTGTENQLNGAFVFVKHDADGPDATSQAYEYKYALVELSAGQTSTVVKYVEPGSKVYVLANCTFWLKAGAEDFLNNEVNIAGVTDVDAVFQGLEEKINKSFIYKLNPSTGSFMMSGVATVPTANGNGATVLSINVKRDWAKVRFTVNKVAAENTDLRIKAVEEITVRRSVQSVKPFAVTGTAETTYALPYGFGQSGYVQDGLKSDVLSPNNEKETDGATDYTFLYQGDKDIVEQGDAFACRNFYILPNAADIAEKGTIIVVKAKIEKKKADGTWEEISDSKYYKARVSSGMDAYSTDKNSSYTITATIKGEGNDNPAGPDGPDKEDTESDLNIKVEVQPWNLVISNQTIE